jgi:hypothetical protein
VGKFEAEQVDEDAEFLGPEPPPPGSAAYRRTILNICATWEHDEYEQLMAPVWEWHGWRAGVEVMVELMGALAMNARPCWEDAFGNIRVDDHVVEMDDEQILRTAHDLAPRTHPGLPRHEALAASIRDGEDTREVCRTLIPYWNQAATLLRRAQSLADLDPARAVFVRWLNAHYKDRRNWAASLGASATHTHWRWRVMPPGNQWVEEIVSNAPDLRGSLRWANTATLQDVKAMQPDLVADWVSGAPDVRPAKGKGNRKGKARCCPNCGKKRR